MKVLNMDPGPEVGRILERPLDLVLHNPEFNVKDELLHFTEMV